MAVIIGTPRAILVFVPPPTTLSGDSYFHSPQLPLAVHRWRQDDLCLHRHEFSELVFVLEGRAVHLLGTSRYPIRAGDVFLVRPPDAHGYEEVEDLTIYNILFEERLLRAFETDLVTLPGYQAFFKLEPRLRSATRTDGLLHLPRQHLGEVSHIASQLEAELAERAEGWETAAFGIFLSLVVHLCRSYGRPPTAGRGPLLAVGRLTGLLESRFDEDWDLQRLAQSSNQSVRSLLRHFRRATGLSPLQYLLRVRLRAAAALLVEERLSVTQAAIRTGFNDTNYFSRQFKRVMGSSPLKYRLRRSQSPERTEGTA